MTKHEALKHIQEEWAKLLSVLSTFDDDQKVQPQFIGDWSLKDLMVHISSWETVALERLGRLQRGEAVELIPDDQVDEWNKHFVQRRRGWKLILVEGEFESVHARLVQEFERFPEELWDRNVSQICAWLPECTFTHYAEHRSRLEAKFATTQHGVTQ
jgi:hypothetical protein